MSARATTIAVLFFCFCVGGLDRVDAAGRAPTVDSIAVVVTDFAGKVDATAASAALDIAVGGAVPLPARIVTGHDGSLGLAQAQTRIAIAADSDVEIPAEAAEGALIARLVQRRGNVFYDVAQREAGRLRVETPFLVAVIKGTQFNVSVQPDSTTISLFEGRLEIRTPDDRDVIQLNAGEIAIRGRNDTAVRVVGMNEERVAVPRADAAVALARNSGSGVPEATATVLRTADSNATRVEAPALTGAKPLAIRVDGALATAADVSLSTAIDTGRVAVDASIGAELGMVGVDVGVSTSIDLGNVALDTSATVMLGDASVDLGVTAGADLGAGTLDLGVGAGADLGVGVVDLGLDAGTDLGAGTVDLGLDVGAELGLTDVDLGAGLDVDLGSGTVALDGALVAGTTDLLDVGLELGPDVGLEVDLDLDLGAVVAPIVELPPEPPAGGGGLGGLLGRIL